MMIHPKVVEEISKVENSRREHQVTTAQQINLAARQQTTLQRRVRLKPVKDVIWLIARYGPTLMRPYPSRETRRVPGVASK